MSSAERIADQAFHAQSTAEDAIAEARFVHRQVESRIAGMMRHAEIGASSVLGEMSGQVKQMVEQTQSQMSRTVGDVVQQLEREIEVAASSAAAT